MSTSLPKVRGVLLQCEHTVWHRWTPSPGDQVFCERCDDYSYVPAFDRERATYYPEGEWKAYRHKRVQVRGVCARGDDGEGCGYTEVGRFDTVRNKMERHNRLGCETIQLVWELNTLPPNSPPPF